jgi:hypothetical protein
MLVMHAPVHSQVSLATGELPRLLVSAALKNSEGGSPVASKTRFESIPDQHLLKFFRDVAPASKSDFLQIRQSFASQLSANSILRFFFQAGLPLPPSFLIFGDSFTFSIPDFLRFGHEVPQIPLTPSIRCYLPTYVLKGSFTTTWHTMAEALAAHQSKVRIYLLALTGGDVVRKSIETVLNRIDKMASHFDESSQTMKDPFPFRLLDHLIETAQNSLGGQRTGYSWI